MKKPLAIVFFVLILSNSLFSNNNILAGAISWTCIGQDSFIIKMELYRDCTAAEFTDAEILVYNHQTNKLLKTIVIKKRSVYDITPSCRKFNAFACTKCQSSDCEYPLGFELYTYTTLLVTSEYSSTCKIRLVYENCCRSSLFKNIIPNQSFHIHSILNRCVYPFDNSPKISSREISMKYINLNSSLNQGYFDIDVSATGGLLDSVLFTIVPPKTMDGDVSFLTNYNFYRFIDFIGFPDHALDPPKGLKVNYETGNITFTPTNTGLYAYAIKIGEYRNGNLIGEMHVEKAVYIIPDTFSHSPKIITDSYYYEVNPDSTLTIEVNSWHPDPQDTLIFKYYGDIEGAIWTDNYRQTNHPSGIFSWQPDQSMLSDIPYSFSVSLRTPCYVQGSVTRAFQIKVLEPSSNIQEKAKKVHIQIVNSTNGLLDIRISKTPSLLMLYTIDGKVKFQRHATELRSEIIQINTTSFSKGIYTVLVQIDEDFYIKKVLIQ
ncbi:MAG: hypothetical protein HOB88_06585 [Bacteroidetes bacterium]|nr:hypothetical protein [Bacteroidota bacterium]